MKFSTYKLWKEKRELGPSSDFRSALWNKLNSRLPKENNQLLILRYASAVVIAILVIVTSGTGVFAYSSNSVTEGTTLYPIKMALEKAEEKIRKTPEAQAKFYLKQIQRREAEKETLKKQNQKTVQIEKIEVKINHTEQQLEKVNQILESVSTTVKDVKVIEQVQKRLEVRKERIEAKIKTETEKLEKIEQKLKIKS